ncbi:MAG: hemerythrin domain-containing protein [Gammaproteobacteria bacterium]|nr:hemerythrin domain-containing protein [Gammaproteobacteria bacterium]
MSRDIYELLTRQHNETKKSFDRLFGALENHPEDARERRETGRKLVVGLITHNDAESQILYARLMKFEHLRGQVEEHRHEHEEANAKLMTLLESNAEDPEWLGKFREIRAAVEKHIEDEEANLFPQAKKVLGGRESRMLAEEFTYLQDLRRNLMQPA